MSRFGIFVLNVKYFLNNPKEIFSRKQNRFSPAENLSSPSERHFCQRQKNRAGVPAYGRQACGMFLEKISLGLYAYFYIKTIIVR